MKRLPVINEAKYRGEWVALDPKTYKVVGHSKSIRAATAAAKKKGIESPVLHGVPKSDGYFIGGGSAVTA